MTLIFGDLCLFLSNTRFRLHTESQLRINVQACKYSLYSVHKQVIHKSNALPVVTVGKLLPGWILMHIVIEAPLPCMGPCIVLVQQPHSKSLSEYRNTGLVETVSVLC